MTQIAQPPSAQQPIPVRRFWVPPGVRYSIDANGWLSDPERQLFRAYSNNREATDTASLASEQCLILLGEPGIGKTTTLLQHTPLTNSTSATDRAVTVDLGEFSNSHDLTEAVFRSDELLDWREGSHDLCLTLDSFDEAQSRIPTLARTFARNLATMPTGRLQLRIACRTAEWSLTLARTLTSIFGTITTVELLPLRRADMRYFTTHHVPTDEFVGAVERARVVPLASRPLTLNLLIQAFQTNAGLPEITSELYEIGLTALCDEPNLERRETLGANLPSPRQRVHHASWLAAVSTFSGRTLFDPHKSSTLDDSTVLTADDCTPVSDIGQQLQPDARNVREVLMTGLFSGRGGGKLGWAHATFADFLAARWLNTIGTSDSQIQQLLCSEDHLVYPQTRRVAAWLVAIDHQRHGYLVDLDPEAFLVDVEVPDPNLRARIVEAVLDRASNGLLFHDYSRNFSNMRHPEIEHQLRKAFARGEPEPTTIAIDMARAMDLHALVPDLAGIALDEEVNPQTRESAAYAVFDLSRGNPTHLLEPLARQALNRSEMSAASELEGIALLASWPHVITTAEVFQELSDKDALGRGGLYSMFLSEFASQLNDSDLDAAIDWLGRTGNTGNRKLEPLVHATMRLALAHLDEPKALDTIVRIATIRAEAYEELFGRDEDDAWEIPQDGRRRIALAMLQNDSPEIGLAVADATTHNNSPLLDRDDFEWLVDTYGTTTGRLRRNIRQTIGFIHRPDDRDHIELVVNLPLEHPARLEVFGYWVTPVEIDSDQAREARAFQEQLVRRRRTRVDPAPWVNAKIDQLMGDASRGDPDAYWQACRLVTIRPGTDRYMHEFEPDLAAHPRWDKLSAETRSLFVSNAEMYLRDGSCVAHTWLGQGQRSHLAEAGYRALTLLLRAGTTNLEQVDQAMWREWAPIIISWRATMNGAQASDKATLIAHAAPDAQPELIEAVLALVDEGIANGDPFGLGTEIDQLWCLVLEDELLARLETAGAGSARQEMLDAFARNKSESATEHLVDCLTPEKLSEDRARALDAASRLFSSVVNAGWPHIRTLMETDPDFVAEMLLAYSHTYRGQIPNLTEFQAGDLYLWVVDRFPHDDDPQFDDAHWVGPRESLGRWRDELLQTIVKAGTLTAVSTVERIAHAHPQRTWLHRLVVEAKSAHLAASWRAVQAADLQALVGRQGARLVNTESDLYQWVIEALDDIQVSLQGDTPTAQFLWNTATPRIPKTEDEISDYLSNRLSDLLADYKSVVNREVQVRRNSPSGLPERTDIRVDAAPQTDRLRPNSQISIPIEVKGSWNTTLLTSPRDQLIARYMRDIGSSHGIYVVAWFDPTPWDTADVRRQKAAKYTKTQLQSMLDEIASEAYQRGLRIHARVLDASYYRP